MRIGSTATRAFAALALAAAGQAAMALEFGFEAAASNLQLPWTPVAPVAGSPFPGTNFFWGGEAWMRVPIGEDATVRLAYDRDPVLRNSASLDVQFDKGIASVSVGPLVGFLNSDSVPISAGLSASVRLQWPGVAYVSVRSDGGTAISVFQLDSDPQARTELAAGFYLPNAIVSGVLSAKRFNELDSGGDLVTDSLTRYAMTLDIFKKNVPYTALFSLGYELRSKHFAAGAGSTDSLGAIVMGVDATVQLNRSIKLLGGISTGAYVFGLDDLSGRGPETSTFLFGASLGMSVDTAKFQPVPAKVADPEPEEAAAAPLEGEAVPEAVPEASEEPAKPAFSRLALDLGAGLRYDSRVTIAGSLAWAGALLNSRGGAWASLGYRFSPSFALGGEAGFDYISLSSSGISMSLFDLPLRAVARFTVGKLGIEAFGGAFINGITANTGSPLVYVDLEGGARFRLGGLYAEASYVFGIQSSSYTEAGVGAIAASYPSFGLGYAFSLIK
jgi:hypothetical protein